jgi:hypothetical protein
VSWLNEELTPERDVVPVWIESLTAEESPATASLVAPMSLVARESSSTVACSLSTCELILATAASKVGRTPSGMEDERP